MPRDLDALIEAFFQTETPQRLGVAVSGGSDSTALLILLHRFCIAHDIELVCATVDHGLRAEAKAEAAHVARLCAALQVPHETLTWSDWKGKGNVQAAAREARYRLLADWAQRRQLGEVALGHTLDDQAETVLMRLARGAGVDGLSAMAKRRTQDGVTWLRPLLGVERDDLRRFLKEARVAWVDDPTNDDSRFDRIKIRQSWDVLAPLGVTPAALAQVAENMRTAREALSLQTREAAARCTSLKAGAVRISQVDFDALPDDIARRLILSALSWVNSGIYAPRGRSLQAALRALREEGSATVDGCHLRKVADAIWVFREYNAVKDLTVPVGDAWDSRWLVQGAEDIGNYRVSALGGTGLAACPDWRATDIPRDVLLVTPAVWNDHELVAAPLVDASSNWRAQLTKPEMWFL